MPTTATDVQVPAGIPVLPGVVLSGRYVLSGVEPLNKGDTLEVLPLPGGQVAVFVVDVVGSGVEAAVAVSQIKAILRDRLRAEVGLLSALASVDQYAHRHEEVCAATACALVLSLEDGEVEWATAGHPPPLWLGKHTAPRFLPGAPSRPLGTGGRPVTHRTRLEVGDLVGLYTDGLVHVPGEPLSRGYDRLFRAVAEAVAEAVAQPLDAPSQAIAGDELCERVLSKVLPAQHSADDAAFLLVARSPRPEPLRIRTEAIPMCLPVVRREVNRWLDALGVGLVDHIGVGHAVVELVANVVAHAYVSQPAADALVQVDAQLANDGTVNITVSDRGQWREHEGVGRGLMMAAGLTDSLRVVRSRSGTRVSVTQRLTRPVPMLQQETTPGVIDESQELSTTSEVGRMVAVGAVDDLSVEDFHAALTRATKAGTDDAVVDLSGVSHLASPGVQALFEFVGRSKRAGATLTIKAPADSPAGQVLHLVDLPFAG